MSVVFVACCWLYSKRLLTKLPWLTRLHMNIIYMNDIYMNKINISSNQWIIAWKYILNTFSQNQTTKPTLQEFLFLFLEYNNNCWKIRANSLIACTNTLLISDQFSINFWQHLVLNATRKVLYVLGNVFETRDHLVSVLNRSSKLHMTRSYF